MQRSWLAIGSALLWSCLEGDPNPFVLASTPVTPATATTIADAGSPEAGKAIALGGTTDGISFDGKFLPGKDDGLTIELMVKTGSIRTGDLVGWGNQGPTGTVSVGMENGHVRAIVGDAVYNTPVNVNDGNWHHVALACSSSFCDLFVDGSQQNAGDCHRDAAFAGQGYVGYAETLSFPPVDAMVDEVRIWKVKRYSGDIATYKDKPVSRSEAGLVVYFQMENANAVEGGSVPQLAKSFFTADGVVHGKPTLVEGSGIAPAQ